VEFSGRVIFVGFGVAEDRSTETLRETCEAVFDLIFKLSVSA
jgi:hypothetical protein